MPDYFTHCAVAQHVYKNLHSDYKSKILSPKLFTLGAQGGDIFYTYNLHYFKGNLGKIIHNKKPKTLFEKLIEGNLSYAAGFATHYALDSLIHPIVYAFERQKLSPLAHYNFEADLGLFVCARLDYSRRIMKKDDVLECSFAVYDSVKKIENSITVSGIERCLKRHFYTTEFLFKSRRINYRYDFDYKKLSPLLDNAINFAENAVLCVLNKKIDENIFEKNFLNKDLQPFNLNSIKK